jgi:hypothetical protein
MIMVFQVIKGPLIASEGSVNRVWFKCSRPNLALDGPSCGPSYYTGRVWQYHS